MKQQLLVVVVGVCLSCSLLANPGINHNILHFSPNFQSNISGKVVNDVGEPLSGVTITAKGTTVSTVTDAAGNFSILMPAGVTTLVFSYVGHDQQEVDVSSTTTVSITMKPSEATLSDVVVIGYSTQKKANLTGSVSTISGRVLTRRPAPNSANLLQGQVPGLQVTQPSAEPGRDNPNLLIRGRTSFSTSTSPLVLIDGVIGNLNNLSPNDIENITVLKDAASASIYGSRAANGVILVTTKKGTRGATLVNYTANFSRQTATELPDFITNSAEYMEMYNAAATRSGIAFKYAQAEIDKYRNATDRNEYPNFDAVDHYFQPAFVMNHNISASGGSDKSIFNLSTRSGPRLRNA